MLSFRRAIARLAVLVVLQSTIAVVEGDCVAEAPSTDAPAWVLDAAHDSGEACACLCACACAGAIVTMTSAPVAAAFVASSGEAAAWSTPTAGRPASLPPPDRPPRA